ncbi:RIP metalloprotease RseP [Flavobacterium psychrophilum]|uniref:Zinc metalloprotease n=2 Tax=Flavobacterium psychrophilum TaxID=96345 RepID=A6GVS7_FLAPJ|nr:RIP metalloprotease RseP [Flavobacterium psychrophilum]AIG29031.1 zinc metalloprotease [Flavobacterium psychrophilum]AIG31307.1 zinc metalloprotease [Flavobacterium psychrophilum]AIG35727.1 zinc metalloprotease [Flavobacterium psychrophilum]AIG35833.1 zinc metalloprotease [Flavobacterium psychrophilum]AIG38088.1 zinc metalloprotease [Flavobacterium psychrophilum]
MDTLIQIAQIIFILSVLVILHEFGHYITARMFKVKVEKFYLFIDLGFSLFKKKINDTEWGIGWLPMGGYVKLSGMIDESMDTEQMAQPAQPWEFRSKPAWQRLIIMLGGIAVNIILAILIYTILFSTVGQKYASAELYQKNGLTFSESAINAGFKNGDKILSVDDQVQPKFNRMIIDVLLGDKVAIERAGKKQTLAISDEQKSKILGSEGRDFIQPRLTEVYIDSVIPKGEANKAGLLKGDKITKANGQNITFFDEFTTILKSKKSDSIQLTVLRAGKEISLNSKITPEGKLDFYPTIEDNEDFIIKNKLSLAEAIPAAVKESYTQFVYNIKQFKLILRPKTEAYKQVMSPIGITQKLPKEWNWEFIWGFTAMFSIGLAFMNLLPIPGLDGGHAIFTIAEMITGKTLSVKAAERVQTVGMIILLILMTLTFGKDIYSIILKNFL